MVGHTNSWATKRKALKEAAEQAGAEAWLAYWPPSRAFYWKFRVVGGQGDLH